MEIRKIKRVLILGKELAKAGFKLKIEGSYLGILWYLLNPILLFLLLYLIFYDRLGTQIPFYALYLFLGISIFNLFQQSTIESTRTIIYDYQNFLKALAFPREAIVGGVVLKNVFSQFFEFSIFFLLLIYFSKLSFLILVYPLIIVLFAFFVYGSSLILASFTVYFRDLYNIWQYVVRLIWLGTPIFYEIGGQIKLFYLNLFNPLYYFITLSREILIYNKIPDTYLIFGCLFWSALFLLVGSLIFNKLKSKLAELV